RNVERVTEAAMQQLMGYEWPGNVRELENILGRAIIFMSYHETAIDVSHLPELKSKFAPRFLPLASEGNDESNQTLSEMLERYEAKIIQEKLTRLNGNKTATARALGLSVRNLYYKLEKYHLEKNSTQ
ncbi:MAG: helix-turn-helix domain-containing protein, partial [Bacillota bacterium]|nr:helix-turn-helix domain-containing protein [Bacillota bacterium]